MTTDVDSIKNSLVIILQAHERDIEKNADDNFISTYSKESSIVLKSIDSLTSKMNLQIGKVMH